LLVNLLESNEWLAAAPHVLNNQETTMFQIWSGPLERTEISFSC